jgi:hypothetical protein
MTVMDRPTVELLDQQAAHIAAANPPSKVALICIAFMFTALGFIVGRTWYHLFKCAAFCALALRYGYRSGMKVPVEARPAPA